ncbi:hypothetical protein WA026_011763 [Henosepilachna vigintioctopunctata]|uniref:HIT domain-containing protein n=1 Tax=Henosepilachna vigintioctopunctata TaxID=420089 RepID=A0AAW1UIL4_9CUCU
MSCKRIADKITGANTVANKKLKLGHWSQGLLQAVEDPALLVKSDEFVNVIKDKYPKAKFHYLVVCKKNIGSLNEITKSDMNLLRHMDKIATELTNETKHENNNFKIGYHAEPSMARLHLHIISDDMNSSFLKTKKHWNSFNSDFFIPSSKVIQSLEDKNKLDLPSKEKCKKYLELPLLCHKCSYVPKNIPDLKKHILSHCLK